MKKLWIFVLVISFIFASCEKNVVEEHELMTKNAQLSVPDAFKILQKQWCMYYTDSVTTENTSISEVTTDEIYQKTGCLVFKVSSSIQYLNNNCFVVFNDNTGKLLGVNNAKSTEVSDFDRIIVTDILGDHNYQMMFIYGGYENYCGIAWFETFIREGLESRVGQTRVGLVCSFGVSGKARSYLSLEKASDQDVFVRFKDDKYNLIVGKITIDKSATLQVNYVNVDCFRIKPNLDIPAEVKKILGDNWMH